MTRRGSRFPQLLVLDRSRTVTSENIRPLVDRLVTSGRAALVVAHPGHELRVHGWLERATPLAFVLTDGSGHTHSSRVTSTDAVLASTQSRVGSIYGRFSDQDIYRALLAGDDRLFCGLAEELARAFITERIDYVVGDALEGYNPTHDLCRSIIDAAVALAGTHLQRRLANFDFPLTGRPDVCEPHVRDDAIWIELGDEALERKLTAARGYPELAEEVEATLESVGVQAFRVECLRPATAGCQERFASEMPAYERFGEARVAARLYDAAIRYRQHVRPIQQSLRVLAGIESRS